MGYNSPVIWLLRSPFHAFLDSSTLLVNVTGCKSGRIYTTPVNYLREGNTLWVTSQRERTWWRNLRGGASLSVVLKGKVLNARGEAIVSEQEVAESLKAYFRKAPHLAKYFKVGLDSDGQPLSEDCARAAKERVMIKIDLT